jgi:hypothetical protein
MKTTTIYSIAVKREINAINEKNDINSPIVKKRINVELICALATLGAIVLTVYILHLNGLIREF